MLIRRSVSCSQVNHGFGEEDMGLENRETELSDECGGERKKRLKREQVKELERSFESRNKLDPERKLQLAKSLGLQPRQIAIWFQNRRARWKGKQLEKEYCLLKKQFDSAMADNEKQTPASHQPSPTVVLKAKYLQSTPLEFVEQQCQRKQF